jgi:nicotinate-nucleotide pyrophosphorylase (carboxylating)
VQPRVAEGEWRDGGPVLDLEGSARGILAGERTARNSSGASPAWRPSRRATSRRSTGRGATILATRKTTPGLRALEKAAVRAGGGRNHRAPTARKGRNTRADHALSIGGARLAHVKNLEGR